MVLAGRKKEEIRIKITIKRGIGLLVEHGDGAGAGDEGAAIWRSVAGADADEALGGEVGAPSQGKFVAVADVGFGFVAAKVGGGEGGGAEDGRRVGAVMECAVEQEDFEGAFADANGFGVVGVIGVELEGDSVGTCAAVEIEGDGDGDDVELGDGVLWGGG